MLTLPRKVKIPNEIHLDPHFRKLHMEIWIKLVETKRVPLLTQHDDFVQINGTENSSKRWLIMVDFDFSSLAFCSRQPQQRYSRHISYL